MVVRAAETQRPPPGTAPAGGVGTPSCHPAGRLAALQSDVSESGADFAPTTQQQAVFELFTQRLRDASVRFAAFMERELPAFGAELRKAPLKDIVAGGVDAGTAPRTGP